MTLTADHPPITATPAAIDAAIPHWLVRHRPRPATRASRAAQRGLDLVVVTVIAPVVCLCVLVFWAAIRLSDPRSPGFYSQMRTGEDGRRFRLWKLRTMEPGADARIVELAAANTRIGPHFKIPQDPRVTRLGRFLRRTHLDELPQLWSVVIGDMSLVGPRPTSYDVDVYQPHHKARLDGRPGLTGLWQISDPRPPSFDDRVRLDVEYLARRSVILDLSILCRTIPVVLRGRGDR